MEKYDSTPKKTPLWNSNWTHALLILLIMGLATIQSAKNELITQSNAVATSWNHLEPDLLNQFEIGSHLNPAYKTYKNQFIHATSPEEKIKVAAPMHIDFSKSMQHHPHSEIKRLSEAFARKTTIDIEDYNLNVIRFNTTRNGVLHRMVNKTLNLAEKPLFPTKNL